MQEHDELQVVERVEISDDEDDGFEYKYAEIDEALLKEDDESDGEEDLASMLAKLQHDKDPAGSPIHSRNAAPKPTTHIRPSVVDDFIRNFLIKAGMSHTLECFNTEWYELLAKGKLPKQLAEPVPDVYLRNQELDEQVQTLRGQVEKMQEIANKAQSTWDKFRRERDFHRMHHKRVVQEKEKLAGDVKRLRNHIRSYEPMIAELRRKYEVAMKEKMLISLERDRLKEQLRVAEMEQPSRLQEPSSKAQPESAPANRQTTRTRTQTQPQPQVQGQAQTQTKPRFRPIPVDDPAVNPFIGREFEPASLERFQPKKSFRGHLNAVSGSCLIVVHSLGSFGTATEHGRSAAVLRLLDYSSALAFHPRKPVFATASDDLTWKLWSAPDCELIMSGEGHTGWLSDVDFHPSGAHLGTASGDGTVKIWDFQHGECAATFTDHTLAVWGCAFHYTGDLLASCSLDQTARLWDIATGKCRQTFRGHVDSVNAVRFQTYTSNICTASGDKTVSVWDCRSGLCVQTFFGHANSCNDLACSVRGDLLVSCDADGVIKVWDIRMVAEVCTIETSQYPIQKIHLDRSGTRIVAGGDDNVIRALSIPDRSCIAELRGHDGPVQCVKLDPTDSYLLSGASDNTFRIWG